MFGHKGWHHFGPRHGSRHWGPFSVEWDIGVDGGGRGRSRRRFESGELRLILLKLIQDQPRHGYDLIREIEELSGGAYAPSPGVVYPTLTLLQDMGHIEDAPNEGARKPFQITPAGHAHLVERAGEVDALFAILSGMDEKRNAGGAPIKRAVGNLLSALWHRVTAEDMRDDDRLHEIAAILDEAAQKIERL